ncbi:alpha-L-fucosidase [Wenyingzhuangia fucanilytica]|uniref:alpha-L-fucosidase n=1 Tax=Wenyingzhuangia fucanilytica TaxID=1790137 RepID=A0A1B1NX89_9FLAO|nr:alpha-L-fucosidase [Wenyingzhuangia fucanilytica]ANS88313.1 fucosidase 1 [Wenyingzhuangia fucanilytica]ANW96380.1 alpha-L-fucosidase [Wenyingzhuangia fucanilytica]
MSFKNINKYVLLLATVIIFSNSLYSQGSEKGMEEMWGDTSVTEDALKNGKGKFFDESNFGMFIHWGLFSNLGGVWKDKTYYGIGEWIMNPRMAGIPVDDYKKIANDFNPVNFDAKKIARLAKDAGMKYIIITSKHHEGFAMFDSKVSDFNIVDATPFGRDPMHELADACHELGLGFGFYYSHNQDWTAPGGTRGPKVDQNGKEATFKDYFYNKCKPQVREICTNYGEIDFVWFDTPGDMEKKYVVELAEMVRELQPKAMMCSRVGYGLGDYASVGDMEVPTKRIKGLWETCDTNNDSWSYAWYDNNFKSPKIILGRLIETVGRGGSYLFNVGPNALGEVPQIGAEFLEEAGAWIKKYPQVIYGAGPSPWDYKLAWGDVTTNGESMFLAVSEWPKDGKLHLPGFKSEIASARLLKGNRSSKVNFKANNGWVTFDVPFEAPEKLISVIEVKLKGKHQGVDDTLAIYPNVETELITEFGVVTNAEQKNIRWMEKFGEWKHVNQVGSWKEGGKVTWTVNVKEAGYYYLDLAYSGENRLVWKTETDEGIVVQNQQAATEKYEFYKMGILEFKTPGKHTITTSLVEGNPKTSSLKTLKLSPINE